MSIGRNHPTDGKGTRDEQADYLNALIAEHTSYVNAAGLEEKADQVAEVLRTAYGHEVRPARPEEGQKERAVTPQPLERAVEGDTPPKKRGPGRPKKATE